jgi:hypothetical protein
LEKPRFQFGDLAALPRAVHARKADSRHHRRVGSVAELFFIPG